MGTDMLFVTLGRGRQRNDRRKKRGDEAKEPGCPFASEAFGDLTSGRPPAAAEVFGPREAVMTVRLGEVLVSKGVLTVGQCAAIEAAQARRARPFGVLAEEMFGVDPGSVESAWAQQFAASSERVDVRRYEPAVACLELIERRQAWQFGVLPIDFSHGLLRLATTPEHLLRAMRFVNWKLTPECQLILTEPVWLEESLSRYYPMPGARLRSVG